MKKKIFESSVGFSVHGYTSDVFSHLEGRLRTIIEAIGLPEKQEKSLSDLVVGEIWNVWNEPKFHYLYEGKQDELGAKLIK